MVTSMMDSTTDGVSEITDTRHRLVQAYGDYRELGESAPKAIWSVVDARGRIAWKLRDIGWAIIHTADRMEHEEPLSLDDEFQAGHRIGYRAGRRDGAMFMAGGEQS